MSDANRMRMSFVDEVTPGTTPASPTMREARLTGEGLVAEQVLQKSAEIRSDAQRSDPTQIGETGAGQVKGEFSYPVDGTWWDRILRSGFRNPWVNTVQRDNGGVADSVITDVNNATQVVTVTTGPAFVIGHLAAFTGFTNAANGNGVPNAAAGAGGPVLRRCTTGSATVPAFAASGLVAEAAPPGTARIKVVGFEGVAGDITATASGLASTTLDFTTLGVVKGMWLKIGGAGAAFRFANVAANNDWVRVSGDVTANAIPLDNLPSGWGVDNGATKTIRVFFGDRLRNGITPQHMSIEKSFLDQAVPVHLLFKGQLVGKLGLTMNDQEKILVAADLMGMSSVPGTVANGSAYLPATTNRVMSSNAHIGRIAEAGATMVAPNIIKNFTVDIDNAPRPITGASSKANQAIGLGTNDVSGTAPTYFGSIALLSKVFAGTITSLSARSAIDNQAVLFTVPRATLSGPTPSTEGENTDVMLPVTWLASADPVTGCQIQCDRFEYFEA